MNDASDQQPTREQAGEQAGAKATELAAATVLRRRRALVFGEVLPESTPDHLDDEWWRSQVPPHHG